MQTTVPVSLKLEPGERERLKALAKVRHRKPHFLMREAIQQYLEREEARESFRQSAMSAWRDYQEAGQHLTGPELGDWLDTWGSTQEKAAPPCHE